MNTQPSDFVPSYLLHQRAGMRPSSPLVSCVIPAYNEGGNIVPMLRALNRLLTEHGYRHELIVVDDGSRDDTVERVLGQTENLPLTVIQLSRNFGKELALTAGIDHADGDVVVLIDADFQHPPEMVPAFLQHWKQGYDMVYGIRADRIDETSFKRWSTRMFYSLINVGAHQPIPENTQDFRVLDRCIVLALRAMPERNRFMKGLYSWVGFTRLGVMTRTSVRREGESSFNAWRLLRLAATGVTAFSNVPLRIWTLVGGVVSLGAIVYALYIILDTLINGNPAHGWPTIIVAVLFLGGVQLLSIGILGEYLGRIYDEVKRRPSYFVSRKTRGTGQEQGGQDHAGPDVPGSSGRHAAWQSQDSRNGAGVQEAGPQGIQGTQDIREPQDVHGTPDTRDTQDTQDTRDYQDNHSGRQLQDVQKNGDARLHQDRRNV